MKMCELAPGLKQERLLLLGSRACLLNQSGIYSIKELGHLQLPSYNYSTMCMEIQKMTNFIVMEESVYRAGLFQGPLWSYPRFHTPSWGGLTEGRGGEPAMVFLWFYLFGFSCTESLSCSKAPGGISFIVFLVQLSLPVCLFVDQIGNIGLVSVKGARLKVLETESLSKLQRDASFIVGSVSDLSFL